MFYNCCPNFANDIVDVFPRNFKTFSGTDKKSFRFSNFLRFRIEEYCFRKVRKFEDNKLEKQKRTQKLGV